MVIGSPENGLSVCTSNSYVHIGNENSLHPGKSEGGTVENGYGDLNRMHFCGLSRGFFKNENKGNNREEKIVPIGFFAILSFICGETWWGVV